MWGFQYNALIMMVQELYGASFATKKVQGLSQNFRKISRCFSLELSKSLYSTIAIECEFK